MRDKLMNFIQKLLSHEGFKRYGSNTAWLMAEKVLRMFIGLFVGIWIARYLGPEQFGLLSYAQSFVFLFTAIATLGLDGIVVRELVKDESKRDVLLGTAFTLKLTGALLILPLLWLGVHFTDNDAYTNLLVFIIASATIFQSFNVIDFYYKSKVMSKYVALANSASLFFSSIVKIFLIVNEAPLVVFAFMFIFEALILCIGLIYFYKKTGLKSQKWKFDFNIAKSILMDSWPMIFSTLFAALFMRLDQIMIKQIMDDNAVGQYVAAVKLSEAWYFLPTAICTSLAPAIVNAKKQSKNLYYKRLHKLYKFLIFISLIIAISTTILSEQIINILYGESYKSASMILTFHIWTGIFVSLGAANSQWSINENLLQNEFYRVFLGALLNVVLNFFLIKEFGLIGAAIATLITYFFTDYLSMLFFKSTRICFIQQTRALFFLSFNEKKYV